MEKYIVDRFEENFAVLEKESGGTIDVDKTLLPGAKEGDVVIFENGTYSVSEDETKKRKAFMAEKIKRLFGKK